MWRLSVGKHNSVSEWASFPKEGLYLSEENSQGISYDILQPVEPKCGRFLLKLQVPVSRFCVELETHTKYCLALSDFWYLKCGSPCPFLPTNWVLTPLKYLVFPNPHYENSGYSAYHAALLVSLQLAPHPEPKKNKLKRAAESLRGWIFPALT